MKQSQQPSSDKKQIIAPKTRMWAGLCFLLLLSVFALIWAISRGWVTGALVFGACGFKQSTGYPCPGCGVTTALTEFIKGNMVQAFIIQPAGAFLGLMAVVSAIFSLLIALFGVDFGILRVVTTGTFLKRLLLTLLVVFLAGWAVTLSRAFVENNAFK